jgi:hypothetical protein
MIDQHDEDDEDDDPFGPAVTELNGLDAPIGQCQWDRGCSEPATFNVAQYDVSTAEDLLEGVDANFCEPHARAMAARLGEYET